MGSPLVLAVLSDRSFQHLILGILERWIVSSCGKLSRT